jgi:hypothetical protein
VALLRGGVLRFSEVAVNVVVAVVVCASAAAVIASGAEDITKLTALL